MRKENSKKKDRFYSDADPKTTAWQLLDVDRCKNKCLLEICIYSDGHPKLTALFTKQLLDLERCKNKCLLEIWLYSDTGPKLLLDQERLIFCPNLLLIGQFWMKQAKLVQEGLKIP